MSEYEDGPYIHPEIEKEARPRGMKVEYISSYGPNRERISASKAYMNATGGLLITMFISWTLGKNAFSDFPPDVERFLDLVPFLVLMGIFYRDWRQSEEREEFVRKYDNLVRYYAEKENGKS